MPTSRANAAWEIFKDFRLLLMRKPMGARMDFPPGVNEFTKFSKAQDNNLQNIPAITMIYCCRFHPVKKFPLR
jgi:hypothetical protein